MHRILVIFIAALAVVGLRSALPVAAQTMSVTAGPSTPGDRMAAIRERGVLRVGTTGDYKPFTYRDPATGDYEGLDIDVARTFARALGVRVEFVQTSWPTLTADVLADKFDLAMGGISHNPARADVGLLSHGYLSDGKRPLIRKSDRDRFRTLADIDQPGVRVAVNPGGTNQSFDAANLKRAIVIVVEKNLSIPALIADGKADVFITDGVEADYDASHDPRLLAVDPSHPYTHDTKVYFLRRDEASLEQALDAFIDRSLSDGLYARLRAKWIG